MRLALFERETIVSSAKAANIIALLTTETKSEASAGKDFAFTGLVYEKSFRVSVNVAKPQNFIPLAEGTVDQTSTGSLILVKYRLFPSTRFFLIFWCLLTFLLALVFLGPGKNYLYGCLSLAGCIANYLIALANFGVHLKQTQKALHRVLDKLT
jgi:hypothetical protein